MNFERDFLSNPQFFICPPIILPKQVIQKAIIKTKKPQILFSKHMIG